MPIVDIPPDLRNGSVKDSSVPGVAAYIGPDGKDRADVYIGLILDGQETYRNISARLPDLKVSFFEIPQLICSTDITFNPNTDKSIVIKVFVSCYLTIKVIIW